MAGSNHHHVWQMLQRGFGERRGRDYHVWVYSKGVPAERTATRLFGSEKYFYGPEGSQADFNITKYENDNQSVIQDIRNLPDKASIDADFASELIAHLEIRSAFLREDASRKMQEVMNAWTDSVRPAKSLKKMLLNYLADDPKMLDDILAKGFVPQVQRAHFEELARLSIEAMSDAEVREAFAGLTFFDTIIDNFPEMMKAGHINVLSKSETFPVRANLHRARKYAVCRPDSGNFILPDTTLAFIKKEGASPFVDKGDVVEAAIIPVSANVAIVGTNNGNFNHGLKAINRILAGCSFKGFVARENNQYYQGLSQRIGKYAKLLSDRDLKKMIRSPLAPTSNER